MELSRVERWILSNQCLILAALYPDFAKHYDDARKALEGGYERHYDWIAEHISTSTVSPEEGQEVIEVLDMFSQLKRAYSALVDKDDIEEGQITFIGFDLNEEPKQYSYARFFCSEGDGRYADLVDQDQFDSFNSHFPVLVGYRRMLAEWGRSKGKYQLTKPDIIRIVSARQANED